MNRFFTLSKYQVVIDAGDRGLSLPPYKGSTLRGGFGSAFRCITCAQRHSECNPCALTLDFQTMTRIKYEEGISRRLEFHMLIRNLLRRLSSLAYFHHGWEMELDFPGLIQKAAEVSIAEDHTRWVDWERYSSRKDHKMNLGGLVGRVTYHGPLAPFKVKEVWLFGSKARGEGTEGSDIDLLIIVNSRGLWKPLHDLADEVEFDLDYPGYISLIVYHIDQWNDLIKEKTSFYREVQRDGKTLYYDLLTSVDSMAVKESLEDAEDIVNTLSQYCELWLRENKDR